ncbi:hypothetical protein PaelaDRAFT_2889 [Paenibacillus lactis 154]|uniref:Uncharacterized protein n=1 Tax=Paenibacillus lactis 154 TaxID=743719 RepID=G4HFX8_9BACL|nr:hypothetical protein PaelaDRAFT_2889 [Paenibacillus lactis 154]
MGGYPMSMAIKGYLSYDQVIRTIRVAFLLWL